MRLLLRITLILVICWISNPVPAQNEQTILKDAAQAYADEEYTNAISLYENLLSQGKEAFELYFNLGNAYYKSDQIAPAILNYERAAKLQPTDEDLQYNLAMAQARTVDKIEAIQVPQFVTGYKSFVNQFSADQWGYFSILAFVFMLGVLAAFLLTTNRSFKKISLTIAILLFTLSFSTFIFGAQQRSWLNSNKEGIIFQPTINVRSGPQESAEAIFVLHEGTKVNIVERFSDWLRIRIGDGNTGWVKASSVQEI